MKRWLYITGIALIILLLVVWLFLLFASDETKTDVFNQFGFTGENEEGIVEEVIDILIPDIFQKQYLRQLTTKRVAGYTEVATASSTLVYFVEAGTGHIFTTDPLIEGSENRISNITIPVAKKASVAKDGSYTAIRSGDAPESRLTLISHKDGSSESIPFDVLVKDFTMTTGGELLYTAETATGLTLRSYDLESDTTNTLANIPFREATIVWGDRASDTHYVYPKTSISLEGYLYAVEGGKMIRLPASGFGLAAEGNNQHVVFTKQIQSTLQSFLFDREEKSAIQLPISFYPEKCIFGNLALYCGESGESADKQFPDNWYRGQTSFADDIWKVDPETKQAQQVVSTMEVSQRELDIISMTAGNNDSMLYFVNKNDQSLWTYEFPPVDTPSN